MQICSTPVIIELGMESQNFYIGLIILASFLFIMWFFVGRKGGYGQPTVLDLKKGESRFGSGSSGASASSKSPSPIVQAEGFTAQDIRNGPAKMRDVTPPADSLDKLNTPPPPPPGPPPSCFFIYNGHDWDAFEVLGVSPYSSFSEITKVYQQQIKKVDPGKHEFLQTAYMAILKKF